jgi:hypothetical protein
MSETWISVRSDNDDAWFICRACGTWEQAHPEMPDWTLAAASDAGRAHLAAHHTAQMPPVAHGDPEPAYVAPGPHTARPGHGWDFPCCNPIQRTYDESRADA